MSLMTQSSVENSQQQKGVDISDDLFDMTTFTTRICNCRPRVYAEPESSSKWISTNDLFSGPGEKIEVRVNTTISTQDEEFDESLKDIEESSQKQEEKLATLQRQIDLLDEIWTKQKRKK